MKLNFGLNHVLESFRELHECLQNAYDLKPLGYEDCTDLASHLAYKLFETNKRPSLIELSYGFDMNGRALRQLQPLMYKGGSWELHIVCYCDNLVYDPIHSRPMQLEDYCLATFGSSNNIEINVYSSEEYLEQAFTLQNRRRKELGRE